MSDSLDLAYDDTTQVAAGPMDQRASVPCVYCRQAIPAATFAFWSSARRLLFADCPSCARRVNLAMTTLQRWLKQSVA